MNIEELHTMANTHGLSNINTYIPKKTLIRKIQEAKGDEPCFLSDKRFSCREKCRFGSDCKQLTAAWMR